MEEPDVPPVTLYPCHENSCTQQHHHHPQSNATNISPSSKSFFKKYIQNSEIETHCLLASVLPSSGVETNPPLSNEDLNRCSENSASFEDSKLLKKRDEPRIGNSSFLNTIHQKIQTCDISVDNKNSGNGSYLEILEGFLFPNDKETPNNNNDNFKTDSKQDLPHKLDLTELILQFLIHYHLFDCAEELSKEAGVLANSKFQFLDSHLEVLLTMLALKSDPQNKWITTREKFIRLPASERDSILDAFLDEKQRNISEKQKHNNYLWKELEEKNPKIKYEKGSNLVESASLNQLIALMTSKKTARCPDNMFLEVFVLTHQSFTSTREAILKTFQRFNTALYSDATDIKKNALSIIVHLVKKGFIDSQELLDEILLFKYRISETDKPLVNHFNEKLYDAMLWRQAILKKRYSSFEPKYPISDKKVNLPLDLSNMDEETIIRISQQLTLIDFEYYSAINDSEFLDAKWASSKTRHLAPNIRLFTQRFDDIAYWVASLVIQPEKLSARIGVLSTLIRISKYLCDMQNFYALNAFMVGLNKECVNRLSLTIKGLSPEVSQLWTKKSEIMQRTKYVEAYSTFQPPLIPFIGYFQTDLVYIDMNESITTEGLINFLKCRLTYKRIKDIQKGQCKPFKFKIVPNVYRHCKILPEKLTETRMNELSQRRYNDELKSNVKRT